MISLKVIAFQSFQHFVVCPFLFLFYFNRAVIS